MGPPSCLFVLIDADFDATLITSLPHSSFKKRKCCIRALLHTAVLVGHPAKRKQQLKVSRLFTDPPTHVPTSANHFTSTLLGSSQSSGSNEETFTEENAAMQNADVVSYLVEFVDHKQYLFFASVSRGWRAAWGKRPTVTTALTTDTSVSQLSLSFDCGLRRTVAICSAVARRGRLDLLQTARAKKCPWNEDTCFAAAERGFLPVLEYARSNGCRWGRDTPVAAASGGHIHVLEFLAEQGCRFDVRTCFEAARSGQLAGLKWLKAHGYPWGPSTAAGAARAGRLDCLKYLVEEGCPLDSNTPSLAAEGGYLDVFRYAIGRGCAWDFEDVLAFAREGGHAHVVEWATRAKAAQAQVSLSE